MTWLSAQKKKVKVKSLTLKKFNDLTLLDFVTCRASLWKSIKIRFFFKFCYLFSKSIEENANFLFWRYWVKIFRKIFNSFNFNDFFFGAKSQVMTWLFDDLTWLFPKKMTFRASLVKINEYMISFTSRDVISFLLHGQCGIT